jgi:ribulose-5-phosphate 4-epimerase/fuculose-1-phosphate aldolase
MLANDPVTQARIDLTTALRAAARHGLNEGVCNHFSMTVPGREDLFLVNPQGLHWSEITPGDLVMADGAGNIIEGKYQVEATAFFIHARIHAGNPRAKVVLHTHKVHPDVRVSPDARGLHGLAQVRRSAFATGRS